MIASSQPIAINTGDGSLEPLVQADLVEHVHAKLHGIYGCSKIAERLH